MKKPSVAEGFFSLNLLLKIPDIKMNGIASKEEKWDLIITPKRRLFEFNLREVWKYKDLLLLFVKRDITTVYKQTILGPVWFFIQPILTSLTFLLVFGKIANLSTDGVPQSLFYLSGVVIWNYFSTCVSSTSNTFLSNAGIFGKVYFPRLVNPISIVISTIIKFCIQLIPLLLLWLYYYLNDKIEPSIYILLFPVIVFQIALLSLGIGLIISSLTTKYRDFSFLVTFSLQLLMYGSAVIYPLSKTPSEFRYILEANPMTWLVEAFRLGFTGVGVIDIYGMLYSWSFTIIAFAVGIITFNKVEKNFMDTV